MKTMVVYYSMSGHTQFVADQICKELDADFLSIVPSKKYPTGPVSKFLWGGKSAVFQEEPLLESYSFDPSQYDTIVIGTPIWAGTYAPPLRTFFKENNLADKSVALFSCSGGGDSSKCFSKIMESMGITSTIATLSLRDPGKTENANDREKMHAFCQEISNKGV